MSARKFYLGSLLTIFGTVLSALGTVSVPWAYGLSFFWPGIVIQVLGGIWFGWVGVFAGILFPTFSNWLTIGGSLQLIGYIPANIAQSALPYLIYRWRGRIPVIASWGDFGFMAAASVVAMWTGAALGCVAIYIWGANDFSVGSFVEATNTWAWIQLRALFFIAVPLMIFVAPKVITSELAAGYWPRRGNQSGYPVLSLKVFFFTGLVTVFPLIIVGFYQIINVDGDRLLEPHYLAIATSGGFFSLLIVASIITDWMTKPTEALVDKIAELSRTQLKDTDFERMRAGRNYIPEMCKLVDSLCAKIGEYEKDRALRQLAEHVAHDIRSPLAALDMVSSDLSQVPEEQRRIIQNATARIQEIARSMLSNARAAKSTADPNVAGTGVLGPSSTPTVLSSVCVGSSVTAVLEEKRARYSKRPGVRISLDSSSCAYGLFASAQAAELKRVLSNLIDNAVDALGPEGRVDIALCSELADIVVRVCDSGRGIPQEVLRRLGKERVSHGKVDGHGLGLPHAFRMVESWGGSLTFTSEIGVGTTAEIRIKGAAHPPWFVGELVFEPGATVVVLDDDTSIHDIWKARFAQLQATAPAISLLHFWNAADLATWVRAQGDDAQRAYYLMDFELRGDPESGLDVAKRLGLQSRTTLVTYRSEDAGLQDACSSYRGLMIPKPLARWVPMRVGQPVAQADAVLIDDDPLVHMMWQLSAKTAGIRLLLFFRPQEFMSVARDLPTNTPIYIDSELGAGMRGELIAQDLRQLGFQTIYLVTGHSPESFDGITGIAAVLDKSPPWRQAPTVPSA